MLLTISNLPSAFCNRRLASSDFVKNKNKYILIFKMEMYPKMKLN